MHWEVDLTSEEVALSILAQSFTNEEISVVKKDDGRYVLRSAEFSPDLAADQVRAKADEIARTLSGAVALILGATHAIKVGAVYRVKEDGRQDIFVHLEPAVMKVTAMPVTLTITRKDGTVESRSPGDPTVDWVRAALKNPAAAKVLRLFSEQDLNWPELYRLFDVIEEAGSSQLRAWVADSEIRRFKHTANSVAAAGDQARHGWERTQPPKNPMSLKEAKSFVRDLARKWLSSLGVSGSGKESDSA